MTPETNPPRPPSLSKWIEIDLGAIAHNLSLVREMVGKAVSIFACLKRNATGCGTIAVGTFLAGAGADGLAVGDVAEAVALRQAGVTIPILLYPGAVPADAPTLCAMRLMPTISTLDDVRAWSAASSGTLAVFLKIDAGGLRAGALPGDAVAVARAIISDPRLALAGVYGHPMSGYGAGDDLSFTDRQLAIFTEVMTAFDRAGIHVPIRMVASSAILLSRPTADLNAVDPGRLLVGIGFAAVPARDRQWRTALVGLKTRLVMKKPIPRDALPDLPRLFPLREGMVIGLVPFGYGDGYPRALPRGAAVLIRGRSAAVIGPVHSELLRVDLTDIPDAEIGDEVVIVGRSGAAERSLTNVAAEWGKSPTEFMTDLRDHIPRIYAPERKPAR